MINGITRDVDVYLLGAPKQKQLPLQLGVDALMAYGPAAAVQRFIVELMTPRGSVVTDLNRGTTFYHDLISGKLRTEQAVIMSFTAAAFDAVLRMTALRPATYQPDEELADVQPLSALVSPGEVSITAVARTLAGTSITFVAPFSV